MHKRTNRLAALGLALAFFAGTAQAGDPYYGEIRLFAGNFAPMGWAFADGSILAITEHTELFQLIGTTYGGDGQTTFALPDLRGRVPVHRGTLSGETVQMGQSLGAQSVAILAAHLPAAQTLGDQAVVTTHTIANAVTALPARTAKTIDTPTPATGGGQPLPLKAPYLGLNYIISLTGVFPQP